MKRELGLAGVVEARQKEIDSTASRLEALESEIALIEKDLERLRALQQDQEKESMALELESRKLAGEKAKADSSLSWRARSSAV